MTDKVQYVFLVGAKSIGNYGGYETFINKLTEYHQDDKRLQYVIACKANGEGCMDESKLDHVEPVSKDVFRYHNALCFKIHVPNIGSAQAIYYDVKAMSMVCDYIKKNHIENAIVYIMACRIGPFMAYFQKRLHGLGARIFLNPDGHEWKRGKWSKPIRTYWKKSEKAMVTRSDYVICDSINIEKYIHESYDGKCRAGGNPSTTFIAYGAETRKSQLEDNAPIFEQWLSDKGLKRNEYYLVVGRFVPENNYETMIKEFMKSHSQKDFAIITPVNDKFLNELESKLNFSKDKRIKFVGTVYNPELLMKIRENAYAYFHGHEVGGTNPSLLEALGSTKLNLLLKVGFNEEVARDSAIYWSKEDGSLAKCIDKADAMSEAERSSMGERAKQRIKDAYSWEYIASRYAEAFLKDIREDKKLRIAMLGQKRVPSREGGVEIVVEELATRMSALGHEVTCYNRSGHHVSGSEFDSEKLKEYKGVKLVDVFTINKKGLAAMTSSVMGAIRVAFGKYDVVHFHAEGPASMCWLPKLFGKKIIVTIHGLDWARAKWGRLASWYIKSGEKNAVRYADEIIVLSQGVQEYFEKEYGRKTIFIPNGVNRPQIRDAKIIKDRWGLNKDAYILYLGRLVPEKGIHYLLEAMREEKAKKLVIAGGASDTLDYMEKLKEIAGENVIFTDFVQGEILDELYSNAYIYCLPSDLEGMPLSLLEAMSYGNCCVVSDIDECAEVVEDKAFVFGKGNIRELQSQLEMLIASPEHVQNYKEDAAEFICSKYNWDDVVKKTLELYK